MTLLLEKSWPIAQSEHAVGQLIGEPVVMEVGDVAHVRFIAESGAGTDPCFRRLLPMMGGHLSRVTAWPITNYAPSQDFNLVIETELGNRLFGQLIDKDGADQHLEEQPGPLVGPMRIQLDDMGAANKRAFIDLAFSGAPPQSAMTRQLKPLWAPRDNLVTCMADPAVFYSSVSHFQSGIFFAAKMPILKGQTVTNLGWVVGNSIGATLTDMWMALYDVNGTLVDVTADFLTTLSTYTAYAGALSNGPVTFNADGWFWVALCIVGSTMPQFAAFNIGNTSLGAVFGSKWGRTSDSGLTNPASAPSTLSAISTNSHVPFFYCT